MLEFRLSKMSNYLCSLSTSFKLSLKLASRPFMFMLDRLF